MASIAEILLEQGRQAADAQRQQGAITGQLYSHLGQIVAGLPSQYQQAQRAQQEDTARGLEVAQMQRTAKSQTALESVLKDPTNYNADGTSKDDQIAAKLKQQDIGAWEHYNTLASANAKNRLDAAKTIAEIQASTVNTAEKQQQMQAAQAEYLGNLAYTATKMIDAKPDDPMNARDTTLAAVAHAAKDHLISEDDGKQFIAQTATASPQQLKQVFSSFVTPSAKQKGEAADAELTLKNADALSKMRGPAPTGAEDDQKYENLLVKKRLTPKLLTPEDAAFIDAYNQRKTVTTDAAAIAASNRQAEAQDQANKLQKRAQDFNIATKAREELSQKVEAPYLTARTSADTLRDVVDAASKGNKVAASLQSLEATMGAIRSQGLNRINSVEIGATADAGNLFDRISGWMGKAAEGQPVPADIQKDMRAFADILDKAAYKKYSDSFDSVAKYYDLNDQQKALKMAPPVAAKKTVSIDDVKRVAAAKGQSYTDAKKDAESEGFIVQ